MKTTLSDKILLEALLERSLDHIYFKDIHGRFIRTSRSLARWFGRLDPAKLIGKTDHDFFSPEHANATASDEQEIMRTQIPIEGKVEKETWPDGSVTWVATSKLPLQDENGQVIGIHGISHDVTQLKRASLELERLTSALQDRNSRLELDLRLAAEVFEMFGTELPATLPAGAAPDQASVLCAGCYQPANQLGGDFHLVLPGRPGHTRILLCDVMGHGMQAALVAVLLRTWAQQSAAGHPPLTDWMEGLNARLAGSCLARTTTFTATALALDIDLEKGGIELVRAGHPPPLLQTAQNGNALPVEGDGSSGPGLGLVSTPTYQTIGRSWSSGDRLLLYTDGLSEAHAPGGEDFGNDGIRSSLQRNTSLPLPQLVSALLADARAHQKNDAFEDDVCILAFERRA